MHLGSGVNFSQNKMVKDENIFRIYFHLPVTSLAYLALALLKKRYPPWSRIFAARLIQGESSSPFPSVALGVWNHVTRSRKTEKQKHKFQLFTLKYLQMVHMLFFNLLKELSTFPDIYPPNAEANFVQSTKIQRFLKTI